MATATRLDMMAERLDGVGGAIGSSGPGTAGQVLYWADAVNATSEAALAYNASTNKLTVSGGIVDSALTPGRVVVSTTGGELTDQTGLTASGGALTAANVTDSGLTATRVTFAGTAGLLEDDAGFTYAKATDALSVLRGSVTAAHFTATALATPGLITVTPTLTQTAAITTVAGSVLVDGDYFTLNDGTTAYVFEFDSGGGVTGGSTAVAFTGAEDANAIRDLCITAINSTGILATASSGGAATVALAMDTPGAAGGVNSENVTDAGFGVTNFADPTHATTYTYKLVARLADGTTTEAGSASTTNLGHATLSATNYNALSWSAVTGASTYDVYRTAGGATQGKIVAATALTTASDTGLVGDGGTAPAKNDTGRFNGAATKLATLTTDVVISSAAAPSAGQVLTASGPTAATWTTAGGVGSASDTEILFNNASAVDGVSGTAVTAGTGAILLTAQAVGTTPLAVAGASGQTASLLTVTGGATPGASYAPMLSVSGTLPASPSAAVSGVSITATGAGSAAYQQSAQTTTLAAGYTGASSTFGLQVTNSAIGTGAAYNAHAADTGNFGVLASVGGAGGPVSVAGEFINSGTNTYRCGVVGKLAHSSAPNQGAAVVGVANVGIGGYFANNGATLMSYTNVFDSPLVAVRGDTAGSIFTAAYGNAIIFEARYANLVGRCGNTDGTVVWGTAAASPQAYTHTLSASSRGGTDTDVAGGSATLKAGNGTGTGGSGTLKAQTAYPGTTGTTANTYSDREMFAPKWTTLTETTATAIATLTFGASSAVGAEFLVTVEANDGTEYQSLTTRIRVSSVRKAAGNTSSSISIVGTDTVAASSGTLVLNAATITEGASAATLNLDVTSSLTQTTLRATWQATANGPGLTLAQS